MPKNHAHSVALHFMHFMHYNFCRKHRSLGMTPAMAAGVLNRPVTIENIVDMVAVAEPKPNRPKTYKKRNSK